jgi:hypothetical protein
VKRITANYFIDVGMAFSFILSVITGILKYQAIPRFLVRYDVYLPTYAITQLHKWAGAILAGFVLIHLFLHWKWLVLITKTTIQKKMRRVRS